MKKFLLLACILLTANFYADTLFAGWSDEEGEPEHISWNLVPEEDLVVKYDNNTECTCP